MAWKKGQSGNPKGTVKKEFKTGLLLAKNLIAENAEEIVKKCIELALKGDTTCIKLCMERILPKKHEMEFPEGLTVSLNMVIHEKS